MCSAASRNDYTAHGYVGAPGKAALAEVWVGEDLGHIREVLSGRGFKSLAKYADCSIFMV
jgi:hypothetical protein